MRISDWSSDVCSSDLGESDLEEFKRSMPDQAKQSELLSLTTNIVAAHVSNNSVAATELPMIIRDVYDTLSNRSEESRVGKECVSTCRSRWSPYHYNKKNKKKQCD